MGFGLGDEDYGFWVDAADDLVLIGAPKVDLEDFNFINFPTDSGYISLTDNFGNEETFFFNPNDLVDMDNDLFGFSHAIIDRAGENNLAVGAPGDGSGVVWYIIEDTAAPIVSAQLDITSDDLDGIISQTQSVTYTYTLQNTGTVSLVTTSVAVTITGN